MAVWATMRGRERSPVPRRALTWLVKRSLGAGMLVGVVLAIVPVLRPSADSVPAFRDSAPPSAIGNQPGPGAVPTPGPKQGPPTHGTLIPPGDVQRQGIVVAVYDDPSDPLIVIDG